MANLINLINDQNSFVTNPDSIIKYFSYANNNLNPYLHPIYMDVRNKIKTNSNINDYKSLLCIDEPSKIENIPTQLNIKELSNNRKPENGEIDLYDTKSFSNRTYLLDSSNSFNKNDFLSALRNMNKNPMLFINTQNYNQDSLDELEICDDEPIPSLSYTQFLDRAGIIPTINQLFNNPSY